MPTASLPEASVPQASRRNTTFRAVLCGSFRRDTVGLRAAYDALQARFHVVSPRSLDFVDAASEFARLPDELADTAAVIESRHLAAMRAADLVWLHAPGGYVGRSGAMELGYARALGIPVFTDSTLVDEVLREAVTVVPSPASIDGNQVQHMDHPGGGLARLQEYYRTVAQRRGWADESPRDTLLLLTEEIGELARAVRKADGLSRHHNGSTVAMEEELADVQLYLVHLANALGLDLSEAVTAKERVNGERFSSAAVA